MMSQARHKKTCAYCESTFLVTGSCRDYLYKHDRRYYCGYKHWIAAATEAKEAKAEARTSSAK